MIEVKFLVTGVSIVTLKCEKSTDNVSEFLKEQIQKKVVSFD